QYYDHPLNRADPTAVLLIFIVLIMNLFGHVAHRMCNVLVKLLKRLLMSALKVETEADLPKSIRGSVPNDIRTIRKIFDMEAKMTVYATCPKCCCTYAPENQDGTLVYP
ncbi:hypothetical protein BD410DRAFT_706385, partial [Rickenella mellea]